MITHILSGEDWAAAQKSGEYLAHMDVDGFIHCSTPAQVLDTANRYYASRRDLLLLWIDPHSVKPEIRWEAAGGESFPHIYGPLNLDAVTRVTPFEPDADGVFRRLPE